VAEIQVEALRSMDRLPRLLGTLLAFSLFLLALTVSANASQLSCRLYSLMDATQLLETIKISIDESGQVQFWKRTEAASWDPVAREGNKKVLAHFESTEPTGAKFSVIVVETPYRSGVL